MAVIIITSNRAKITAMDVLRKKKPKAIYRLFSFKSNPFLFDWISHLLHDNDISSRVIFAILILLVV